MTQIYADGSFQLYGLDAAIYSDVYKSAHGFRPRGEIVFTSIEELDNEWDKLQQYIEVNQIQDKECAEAGWDKLVSDIERNTTIGAKSKRDAFRWIADANDTEVDMYGVDYILFVYGINVDPYGYIKKLKDIIGDF